jgi:hypothetical protein
MMVMMVMVMMMVVVVIPATAIVIIVMMVMPSTAIVIIVVMVVVVMVGRLIPTPELREARRRLSFRFGPLSRCLQLVCDFEEVDRVRNRL